MRRLFLLIIAVFTVIQANGQETEKILKSIFDEALTDQTAYRNLEYLCKNTKGRLPGSPAAAEAVEFTRQALLKAGADTVWLQKVPVPHWERGSEKCSVISELSGVIDLSISALGFSVGTNDNGITSGIVEVMDFEELKRIGKRI